MLKLLLIRKVQLDADIFQVGSQPAPIAGELFCFPDIVPLIWEWRFGSGLILSRLGIWGVYMLPGMQTVKHDIHFGKSHLFLPVIPADKK